jgi:hypothetical protein
MGPHGGLAIPLPSNRGFVEYRVEAVRKFDVKSAPRSNLAVIAVYFLGADARTAMSTTPANVNLALKTPERTTISVGLTAESRLDESAGACRFVSAPGSYGAETLSGRLTATIDGRSLAAPVVTR